MTEHIYTDRNIAFQPRRVLTPSVPTVMAPSWESFMFFGILMPNNTFRRFSQILHVPIEFELDSGLWCACDPSLGIDAYTEQLAELKPMIAEQLDVNFQVYALSPDESLTKDAQDLKRNLLRLVGE